MLRRLGTRTYYRQAKRMSPPPPPLTADQLQAQIAALQAQLASLTPNPAQPASASPVASTSVLPSMPDKPSMSTSALKNLKRHKRGTVTGPLPPALASAPKRHIALLFSYEGWAHSGLAYQPPSCPTPLTTVEGCMLEALEKGRLIEPISQGEGFGCGFERCGRTDAGVSSSAQVVNLWVRSDLADPMGMLGQETEANEGSVGGDGINVAADGTAAATATAPARPQRPASTIELPYVNLLNRLLPPTIRILAWSPVAADFSSRFSCIWRHYKYFFSASPTTPFVGADFDFGSHYSHELRLNSDRWQERLAKLDFGGLELDTGLMRDAVRRLVGDHDFRNFCKVDPPKQLKIHVRGVMSATIDAVPGEEDMFVLNLRGGAFVSLPRSGPAVFATRPVLVPRLTHPLPSLSLQLYNQVRHIVALLFLVGARLEPPSIIDRLLWTSDRTQTTIAMHDRDPPLAVQNRKPGYEMADDLPLILWQCGFNNSQLSWRVDNTPRPCDVPLPEGAADPFAAGAAHPKNLLSAEETFRRQYLEMYQTWTEQRLKGIVLQHHLASFAQFAPAAADTPEPRDERLKITPNGAGRATHTRSYIPLFERDMAPTPDDQNARWAAGRGQKRLQKRLDSHLVTDAAREINMAKKAEALRIAELEKAEKVAKLAAAAEGNK